MNRSKAQSKNPSFSSTLLDEICNSFDSKNPKAQHLYFSDNTSQKQSTRTRSVSDRKFHRDRFFGSLSSSSDSNSSIFSSSDTELKKASSRPLCFGPTRIKPRKTEDKALFRENRTCPAFDDYDYSSDTSKFTRHEDVRENQRTRSVKSSGNFRKPKAPVSPGGRIVSFLNSLFSNSRKTMAAKNSSRKTSYNDDDGFVRKPRDYPSTCSSATSFSRSCLNKSSEKSCDGGKRSVRFSQVNFIASENSSSRPIYANEEAIYGSNRNGTRFMSSSLPDEWNIRKSQKKSSVDGGRRSVEDIARDFLRDYRKNQTKSTIKNTDNDAFGCYEDEDDDDGASDSSSDLFELDLMVNHHDRYRDELPVYETTCAGLIL
ncbi:PREDICTED: protein BIG GRAIN 1-like D [Tarenaya hassleriana]|uniref:protein BIG GRAIN 1-like D n=1 Tax=Tarenaya hassleriana TaxID=28532 RepID=UPI00053C8C11|nr:PREDICTED: protein BIG GRAIN 1-like D [Tarenaya hassleriana]